VNSSPSRMPILTNHDDLTLSSTVPISGVVDVTPSLSSHIAIESMREPFVRTIYDPDYPSAYCHYVIA